MSVRLRVVTTVSDHWAGCELHVRNLKWATDDSPIYLQTVEGSPTPLDLDVDYVVHPLAEGSQYSSRGYYHHYSHIDKLDLTDVDVVLFMQQDIVATDKLLDLAQKSHDQGQMLIGFLCKYALSVYSRDSSELVYPRLWEGGLFVPADILRQAIADDVSFGGYISLLKAGSWLSDEVAGWSEFDVSDPWVASGRSTVIDYVKRSQSGGHADTMHEFTLYAMHHQLPYQILGGDVKWRKSSHLQHFQGIETVCRNTSGAVYDDLSVIDTLPGARGAAATVAFMCLLSGKAPMDDKTSNFLLRKDDVLESQLRAVRPRAAEWMSPEELARLDWAISKVCGDTDGS